MSAYGWSGGRSRLAPLLRALARVRRRPRPGARRSTSAGRPRSTRQRLVLAAVVLASLAALAGAGWVWLRDSSLVAIQKITVTGQSGPDAGQIRRALIAAARTMTTLDVKRLGLAAAREIGTFSLKTKETPPKEVTGKYVVVWEKVGKDWKLAADIWNEGK